MCLLYALLCSLCVLVHASDPETVLYVYGSPFQTETTGFATLSNIDQGWETYANGYPSEVTQDSEFKGLLTNLYGTDGMLFGGFQFWQHTYVGGMLHFDPNNLEVEAIGKGISGYEVSSAAYIYGTDDTGNQEEYIIVLGSFWSFQQNPSSSTLNVGVCFQGGKQCYQLGSGLPLYDYDGTLLVVDQMIYALYLASDKTCRVDVYDFQTGNFTGMWQNIYVGSSYMDSCRQSIIPASDTSGIILLGNQNSTDEDTGMVLHKPDEGWTQYGPFPFSTKKVYTVQSIGDIIYLLQGISFYRWDGNWASVWNATDCYSYNLQQFHIMNEWSFFAPCNHSFVFVQLAPNLEPNVTFYEYPEEYSCDIDYAQSSYSPYSGLFIAACVGHTNVTYLDSYYIIGGQPNLWVHKEVGAVSLLSKDISSFCAFGNGKMFISGHFDRIGDFIVEGAAVWNGVAWNRLDPSLGLTKDYGSCLCASENGNKNSMIVVACSIFDKQGDVDSSFLLFAYESLSDPDLYDPSDNSPSQSDVYPFSVVFQDETNPIGALTLHSSVAYIGWTDLVQLNSTITRWSWGFEETLFSVLGSVTDIVPYDSHIYLSGNFGLDAQGYLKTIALYDIEQHQFQPVDNVWDTKSPWNYAGLLFQDSQDNSTIYVGGYFNQAGNLSYAHNIALLNSSTGVFVDNLDGGIPGESNWATSIDLVLYIVYQIEGCSGVPQCLSLTSFDRKQHQWTYTLRSGVYELSQGYKYNPNLGKTSGLTWWMILIMGLGCIVATGVLFLSGLTAYKAIQKHRMRKLHDRFSHIAYHSLLTDLSDINHSLGPIDFQNEEIVLKSVLGRGSFGTVWSCVLPFRKGGTYAVKQLLISTGEADKITAVEKEIQILQQLRHKNIVHFAGYKKEISKSSVEFFLFMELFEKPCSLRGMIEKRVRKSVPSGSVFFTFTEVKNFLEHILAGMQYLHHHGIAHRDLKCANILVRANNITVTSLHIADFGLSKTFLDGANSRILASTVAGTPAFMAPEVLRGEKYDPFKADVWSFGIIIFEILTFLEPKEPGKRPKIPTDWGLPCLQDPFKPILDIFQVCTETDPSLRPDVNSLVATVEDL